MSDQSSAEGKPLAALVGEVLVPVLMTGWILVYAWDLRDVPERHINWLLLMPLMAVCLALLLVILVWSLLPSLRAGVAPSAEGSGADAGFRILGLDYRPIGIVVLLAGYASVAFTSAYVPATIGFLLASAFLLGERRPLSLILLALTTTAVLYAVGHWVLGIELG
jgi:hypothetical protein